MARFYTGENFPLEVVAHLRRLGHDVYTCQESGRAGRGIGDPDVLAHAHSLGRVVLTQNRRHFIRLHRQAAPHSGIVACTEDPDRAGQAARIDAVLAGRDDLAGVLIRVCRPG